MYWPSLVPDRERGERELKILSVPRVRHVSDTTMAVGVAVGDDLVAVVLSSPRANVKPGNYPP